MKKKIKYYKKTDMNNLKEFSQSKYNNSLLKRIKNKRLPEDKKIKKEQKKFYTKREDFSIVHHNPKNTLFDSNSTINMTKHAENRRIERNISMKDIKKCIKNGKCMDVEYLNLKKIYVYKYEYNNISVVYSFKNKFHNIITVY